MESQSTQVPLGTHPKMIESHPFHYAFRSQTACVQPWKMVEINSIIAQKRLESHITKCSTHSTPRDLLARSLTTDTVTSLDPPSSN